MEFSMDRQRLAQLRTQAELAWRKARQRAMRMPAKAWVVLGFFLFAALLMALHTAFASRDATLRLKVQHSFRSAQLSVWVDDDLEYSGKLMGSMKKKFGVLPDSVQGSLSETLAVASGTHQIRVRVASDDGSVQENSISGEFNRDSQRTLSVVARPNDLSLDWQGVSGVVADSSTGSSSSGSGWLGRYTGTLLLTAAGSIISAITGYVLKEFPKQLGSRTAEAPKIQ
jgi:hypothetical protein